jgi:hypothetical protein
MQVGDNQMSLALFTLGLFLMLLQLSLGVLNLC